MFDPDFVAHNTLTFTEIIKTILDHQMCQFCKKFKEIRSDKKCQQSTLLQ